VKQISLSVSQTLLDRLRNLGRRQPQKITLQEQVRKALQELPPSPADEVPGKQPSV
jgi:hypothetical protein